MVFEITNFISPRNLEVLKSTGLHKIAGALAGCEELTIKEAIAIISTKARLRRGEMSKIAQGLHDLAALSHEKLADGPWQALLRHARMPAAMGAGIALAPGLMSDQPMDTNTMLGNAALGAGVGGAGGAASGLARALRHNPGLASPLAAALRGVL